jgi:hypothetical protein
MIATCNKCKKFKVPWDEIGAALMAAHLKECKAGDAAAPASDGCRSCHRPWTECVC